MKVSSISGSSSSIESSLISSHEAASLMQVTQRMFKTLMNILNHIGTAIALGETGNLEAAHEYRKKNSGQ